MELRKIALSNPVPAGASVSKETQGLCNAFVKEIERVAKDNLGIFRTRVREYTFLTSSKDLQLFFGILSEEGQYVLAEIIRKELKPLGEESQILITIGSDPESILVTRTFEGNKPTLTFVPVNRFKSRTAA
jgi:hypothetical protein